MNKTRIATIMSRTVSIIISVMFIVIGLIFYFKFDPSDFDVKASGTIVEIDEHYESIGGDNELVHTVYIDFFAGMKKYEHIDFGSYNSKMKVGDTVEFYYMSTDPTQIAGLNKEKVPYIGLAFAIIGFILLVVEVFIVIRRKHV